MYVYSYMHIYRVCPAKRNSTREVRDGKQRASFYPVTPDKSGVNYGRGGEEEPKSIGRRVHGTHINRISGWGEWVRGKDS